MVLAFLTLCRGNYGAGLKPLPRGCNNWHERHRSETKIRVRLALAKRKFPLVQTPRGSGAEQRRTQVKTSFGKKLQSPVALTFQGFLAGALLFFTTHPLESTGTAAPPPAAESILSGLEA